MEDKALETLRIFLARRGLPTDTQRVVAEHVEKVNLYSIGKVLVIFSQKDKIVSNDLSVFAKFVATTTYNSGVIVVTLSKPSENTLLTMKAMSTTGYHFFHIRELQYDVTQHRMVPPHRILKPDEVTELMKVKNISNPEAQLLSIDSQDIQARVLGAKPGDIIEVLRHSDTAGQTKVWRYCLADVNVA